jgi:hypothetical protein
MPALDTFERKGLFILTRTFALIMIIPLLITMVGAIALALKGETKGQLRVDPGQLIESLKPSMPMVQPTPDAPTGPKSAIADFPNVTIPFSVQKYLTTPQNRTALASRLRQIHEEFRQDYIDNLAEVIQAAEKGAGVDPTDAANAYMKEKESRVQQFTAKQAEAFQMRLYLAGAALSALALVALLSLILVLLAIERNTRPLVRPVAQPAEGSQL